MVQLPSDIFKKYGIWSIIFAILFASIIWLLAHVAASPGTEVSILWGFVKYTKASSKSEGLIDEKEKDIKIFDNITRIDNDSMGLPVNKRYAPWKVRINGVVSNATNYYVYLVVDDGNGEWIEEGLGEHVDNEFEGICSLGANNDTIWLKRFYIISAIITNKKYRAGEVLDRSTIIKQSNKITLFRAR